MTEIQKINLHALNNGAHFLFVSNVLARAKANTTIASKLGTQIAALESALDQEDEDLKLTQKSFYSDEIAEADKNRDALYISYKRAVKGFLGMPVAEMAEAARVLNQHIKDYAIDPRAQLDKETGLLLNFVADLQGKYATEVSTLGLTAFVTALNTENEKVRTATANRTDERMTKVVGALKESRKVSDEAYKTLIRYVDALALIEGETNYASFIDYLNTEIVHYKREVIGQHADASQPLTEGEDNEEEIPGSGSGSGSGSGGNTGGGGNDDLPMGS